MISGVGAVVPLGSPFSVSVRLSGRIPSWLLPSTHDLVTSTSVVAVVCVLVIVPPAAAGDPETLYPLGTLFSDTVYAISSPSAYFGSPVHLYVQVLPLLVISGVGAVVPSGSPFSVSSRSLGRIPSWLLPSTHDLVTSTSVTSGV